MREALVTAPQSRLGIHHVSVSDPQIIQNVLAEDTRPVQNGSGSVVARSNIVVGGCSIAAGTLITLGGSPDDVEM